MAHATDQSRHLEGVRSQGADDGVVAVPVRAEDAVRVVVYPGESRDTSPGSGARFGLTALRVIVGLTSLSLPPQQGGPPIGRDGRHVEDVRRPGMARGGRNWSGPIGIPPR